MRSAASIGRALGCLGLKSNTNAEGNGTGGELPASAPPHHQPWLNQGWPDRLRSTPLWPIAIGSGTRRADQVLAGFAAKGSRT